MPTATANLTDELCWCVNQLQTLKYKLLSATFSNFSADTLFQHLTRLAVLQLNVIKGDLSGYDDAMNYFASVFTPPPKPATFPPANAASLQILKELVTGELNSLIQLRTYQKKQKTVSFPTPTRPTPIQTPRQNFLESVNAIALFTNKASTGARGQKLMICEPSSYTKIVENILHKITTDEGIRLFEVPGFTFLAFITWLGRDFVGRPAFAQLIFVLPEQDYASLDFQLKDSAGIKKILALAREHPLLQKQTAYSELFQQFFERLENTGKRLP